MVASFFKLNSMPITNSRKITPSSASSCTDSGSCTQPSTCGPASTPARMKPRTPGSFSRRNSRMMPTASASSTISSPNRPCSMLSVEYRPHRPRVQHGPTMAPIRRDLPEGHPRMAMSIADHRHEDVAEEDQDDGAGVAHGMAFRSEPPAAAKFSGAGGGSTCGGPAWSTSGC